MDELVIELSNYRLEEAGNCIALAKKLVEMGEYKTAANRSYYAIFHSIRAILALDEIDFRKHSAVISYFRKEYIKTGIFDKSYSDVIGDAFFVRGKSDYDDFLL